MKTIKAWARKLKQQLLTLYLACRDNRVPWYAKVFTACVVAYAFSPIDLIPDFIPVLGYLDDVIIVPLGIMLALKMIPEDVLNECEIKTNDFNEDNRPKNWFVAILIIMIWLTLILCIVFKSTITI
ncbi:YkvA family protein [Fictibacillus terranigra]|uniref:YkvA family protein n=1 Tax=Fictibacillus terranigra TaxID=3058424 RepID=A0ABT8E5Y6_9BACL|nr:YkvA family protein [Fictibacillus sp. CENA-BCM004]MDN4073315.1 YkvA family protein [Fictibacillus sp. CENA-BCM004]